MGGILLFGKSKPRVIVALAAAVLILGATVTTTYAETEKDGLFQRIRTVYNIVEAWHKDGADAEKFTAGAIKGGLEALGDPYTNYFSPEDYKRFMEGLNGTFGGIGAYLEQEGPYIVIASPIKGSPATKAGLMTGDRLLEANGTPLVGATTEKAINLIRGASGTTVTLKVERPAENRTFEITITRAEITIPEVETKMLDNEVGYLALSTFGDDAASSFFKGVEELKKQGAKALVFDLRQNGGGYLSAAVDIAGAFVPKDQPVVWETGKAGKEVIRSSGRLIDIPAVVLVDNGSASASEVLAGAIQDYGAAPLVGVNTFGKGTVQVILSMAGGAGVKVTIAEYLTPKERHVHHIGLKPDYVVENTKPSAERTAPLDPKRLLLPNTVGLDVLYLQYRLQDLGYRVEANGYFDLSTSDVVAKFAKDNGLPAEPAVTEQVLAVLNQKVAAHVRDSKQVDLQLQKAQELARTKIHN